MSSACPNRPSLEQSDGALEQQQQQPLRQTEPQAPSPGGRQTDSATKTGPQPQHSACADSPLVHTTAETTPEIVCLPRLKLPAAGDKEGWASLNDRIDSSSKFNILESSGASSLPAVAHITILIDCIHELVPHQDSSQQRRQPRRCKATSGLLRKQKRENRRAYQHCTDPLQQEVLRKQYHALKRQARKARRDAEWQNKLAQLAENTKRIRRDTSKFAASLLTTKSTAKPSFSEEVATAHFTTTYSDPDRTLGYEPFPHTPAALPPTFKISSSFPSYPEFCEYLAKRPNKSCPGPNGISYLLWKRCPRLSHLLYEAHVVAWETDCPSPTWDVAYMILLAKSDDASHPKLMRNIALSNCDGKLFWGLIAKRLMQHMQKNGYFNGRVQKGFMPGVAGCVEHTAQLQAALTDAKRHHRSICCTWLDAENAFGSVPHNLIQYALEHYHVPRWLRSLIYKHYQSLFARVVTDNFSTPVFPYLLGVFQGGTECTVLFNTVLQLLLDTIGTSANVERYAYRFKADQTIRLLDAAYADDLELITRTAAQNQILLDLTYDWFRWTRKMRLKPVKCVTYAARQFTGTEKNLNFAPLASTCYSPYDPQLTINGQPLRAVGEEGFKYLGKMIHAFDQMAKDRSSLRASLLRWLELLGSTPLLNPHRILLYSQYVIPKISWLLTVSDCSASFCRKLDSLALCFLKKWAGIPRGGNSAILFCGGRTRPGLRVKRIHTTWCAMQVVKWRLLQQSSDPRSRFIFQHQSDKEHASASNRFAPTIAIPSIAALAEQPSPPPRHQGLGYQNTSVFHTKASAYRYFSTLDEQHQLKHLTTLVMQGKWAAWDDISDGDLDWLKLLHGMTDSYLKWCLNACNNSLPTPDNLSRWSKTAVCIQCKCCGRHNPTLLHILNDCKAMLRQGRYTWRHDCVLSVIFSSISNFCKSLDATPQQPVELTHFVRAGARQSQTGQHAPCSNLAARGILSRAADWILLCDQPKEPLTFPAHIAVSSLRPDIVLYSNSTRRVVIIELTCPFEDNIDGAYASSKGPRYASLMNECATAQPPWTTTFFNIQVGSRGYCTKSVDSCLRELGMIRKQAHEVTSKAAISARRSSYLIYCRRNSKEWSDPF